MFGVQNDLAGPPPRLEMVTCALHFHACLHLIGGYLVHDRCCGNTPSKTCSAGAPTALAHLVHPQHWRTWCTRSTGAPGAPTALVHLVHPQHWRTWCTHSTGAPVLIPSITGQQHPLINMANECLLEALLGWQ